MIHLFTVQLGRTGRVALALTVALCSHGLLGAAPGAADGSAESTQRFAYVMMSQGSRHITMRGSRTDIDRARSLRRGEEALLYVRQDGASYVVRDPETLRAAIELFRPQEALGDRQAELGSRQSALGTRQSRLGDEQARLGERQARAAPREAHDLARQQQALAVRQQELAREQGGLTRQQDLLSREGDLLARAADARLRALIGGAIQRGVAQRVD